MKIILKQDWDNLPSGYHKPSPYFSGRIKEIALLKHILLNKLAGAILIGAPRGTGKTDLVYKTIAESKLTNSKLIPVIFNATQLGTVQDPNPDNQNQQSQVARAILINLITRTYTSSRGFLKSELLKKISTLYYQASANKYEKTFSEEEAVAKNEEVQNSKEIFISGSVSFDKESLEKAIKSILPAGVISAGLLIPGNIPEWARVGIAATGLFIYGISQAINFNAKREDSSKTINSTTNTKDVSQIAKTLYLHDNSLGNLEYGLKDFLGEINEDSQGYKLIFVIDEIDKLGLDPKSTLEIIKSFKGLFNHADALFVFITDETVYKEASDARQRRDVNSTLFSQRIYLNRPTVADLKGYLTSIIDSPKDGLNDFENYIIYESRMDFYQIPDNLRDCNYSFENNSPILEWLPEEEFMIKANKQEVITALLEKGNYLYKQESNKIKNEALINLAYETAEATAAIRVKVETSDLSSDEKTNEQFKYDLLKYLSLSDIFKMTAKADEGAGPFEEYVPTGSSGKPVTDLNFLLQYEQELINEFNDMEVFILQIYNLLIELKKQKKVHNIDKKILEEVQRLSGFLSSVYEKIKEVIRKDFDTTPIKHKKGQEEIRALIDEVVKHKNDVIRNNTLSTVKNILEELKIQIWDLASRKELLDGSPNLQAFILENSINNIIAADPENGLKTIFLLNPIESVVTREAIVKEIRADKKLQIVEFYDSSREAPNVDEFRIHIFQMINFDLSPAEVRRVLRGFKAIS